MAKLRGAFTFNAANGMVRKLLPQIETHQILLIDLVQVSSMSISRTVLPVITCKRDHQVTSSLFQAQSWPA